MGSKQNIRVALRWGEASDTDNFKTEVAQVKKKNSI